MGLPRQHMQTLSQTKMHPTTFFKALSDPTRLNLIMQLKDTEALCVCDLTENLQQPQSTISRHLSYLRKANVVTSERRGTWMWYAINADMPAWCHDVINTVECETTIQPNDCC